MITPGKSPPHFINVRIIGNILGWAHFGVKLTYNGKPLTAEIVLFRSSFVSPNPAKLRLKPIKIERQAFHH